MNELEIPNDKKDLAEGTFLCKWPDWVRWLLFLPSAIVVPFLYLVIQSLFQNWFLDVGPNAFYLVLIRSIVYGGGFVLVGSMVAPSHQKSVSIVMLVLVSMFVAIGIFSAIITRSPFSNILEALIILASGGYATKYIFSEF